jgi:hypothetical protein
VSNAVSGAVGERLNGQSGLIASRGDEAGAVADEKIENIMGAMVGVDHGGFRVIPHAARPEEVVSQVVVLNCGPPDFARACGLVLWTGSVDQTANFVFPVEPEGVGKSFGKAAAYWTVANGFDTMYTVFNPTDKAEDIVATFHNGDGSGSYELPIHLEALASKTLDLMVLIEAARPDAHGKVIPKTMPSGGIVFESAEGRAKWMTLVVSGGIYNAHRATCTRLCTTCYGYSNFVAVTPSPSLQAASRATYSDGTVDDFTSSSSWASDNLPVASVDNTSQKGLISGNGSTGTTSISSLFPTVIVYTGTICSTSGQPTCPTASPSASVSVAAHLFSYKLSGIDANGHCVFIRCNASAGSICYTYSVAPGGGGCPQYTGVLWLTATYNGVTGCFELYSDITSGCFPDE